MSRERIKGRAAYRVGAAACDHLPNPYPRGSDAATEWRLGWFEAMMADAVERRAAGTWLWRVE